MSGTKYMLIYPFESREKAFEIANDIDGSLMWQNGNAYPIDNIPAFIIPVSEFSDRWTAPNKAKQQQATIDKLEKVVSGDITNQMKADCLGEFWFEEEIWSEEKEDYVLKKSTIDWVTCKDIYKAMLKSALAELNNEK